MVLGRKTNFFLGKTEKTILLDFGRIVYQKMFFCLFLVFPRKKLVFRSKTILFLGYSWFSTGKPILFLGKLGISLQDQVLRSKECVFHLLFVRVAN